MVDISVRIEAYKVMWKLVLLDAQFYMFQGSCEKKSSHTKNMFKRDDDLLKYQKQMMMVIRNVFIPENSTSYNKFLMFEYSRQYYQS